MTMITVEIENQTFQVRVIFDTLAFSVRAIVNIDVLTEDQSIVLYTETRLFNGCKIATDYCNEFTKTDAKKVVKRYLRYK